MLVLGRKTNESLVIGDDIVITILAVDRDSVKIGVKAPKEIRILREELFQALQEQEKILSHLNKETQEIKPFENLRALLIEQTESEEETG